MKAERLRYATELWERSRAHDSQQADRLARYRNLEPETAELLSVLVRACSPRRVLEIGTSNGYSTIWLADACAELGASLVSVDSDPARIQEARAHLEAVGLQAELRVQDGASAVASSPAGSLDLVFLDAERPEYPAYWSALLGAVRRGGLIAIDNVLSHPDEVAELTELILADPALSSTVVPVGAGLRLVVR